LNTYFLDADNMVSDGRSFFIEGALRATNGTSTIARVSANGGPPAPLVTIPETYALGGLAVDDACVYFSTSNGIFSVAKTVVGESVP
jgi:hypothetical protein